MIRIGYYNDAIVYSFVCQVKKYLLLEVSMRHQDFLPFSYKYNINKLYFQIIMAEVVKIEKSKENEDVLEKAQPGDMIEFIRGAYSHWAIYVGKFNFIMNYLCFIICLLFR